jgi:CRP-like cAMP-binding protein
MEILDVSAGENIITQGNSPTQLFQHNLQPLNVVAPLFAGQDGDYFYIVEKGSFTVLVDGKPVSQVGEGSSFGELALLYNAPRQATIRSDTNAVVFSLDRESYRFIIAQSTSNREKEIKQALRHVPLLAELTDEQLEKLADSVEIFPYNAGTHRIACLCHVELCLRKQKRCVQVMRSLRRAQRATCST